VILVSHFLVEVLELADTVTILRDGRVVRTGPTSDETEGRLVAAMLGRPIGQVYPPKRPPPADAQIALSVQGVHAPGVEDVSLEVRAGEIVVLAGLIGAGRSELARAIYGATTRTAGDVRHGPATLVGTPEDSLRSGVAMIPESRKDDGLFLHRTIRENVSLSSLGKRARFGFVQRRRERIDVTDALEQVSGSRLLEAPAGTLSGGNQQKLLFARAMLIEPRVLLADEPTRGVDVGAKHDIYELIVRLAGDGMAVLLISNEIEEVLGLAHRVVVMRQGRIVAELSGDAMTEGAILEAAFGAASGTAA
jgi:simple sugar transport system ATP-binding protein/ribose transport system ATP-binding protein